MNEDNDDFFDLVSVFKSRLDRLEKIEQALDNFRWAIEKTTNPGKIIEAATTMICEAYEISEPEQTYLKQGRRK